MPFTSVEFQNPRKRSAAAGNDYRGWGIWLVGSAVLGHCRHLDGARGVREAVGLEPESDPAPR